MARTIKFTEKEILEAQKLRDEATTATELRQALSVILMATGKFDALQIAEMLGTSRRTVFRYRNNIGNQNNIESKSWGGRRHCSLTIEEEKEFLSTWEKEALSGGVLSIPRIHIALIERIGHDVAVSTTYRMLARHRWRKVQPDTKHPKSDPVIQDEFKKNSRSLWLPPT